jgi:hypothetical protein
MRTTLLCLALAAGLGCGNRPGAGPSDVGTTGQPDAAAGTADVGSPPDASSAPDADLPEPDAGVDASLPPCGTALRPLPAGLVELAWDDGTAAASLRTQSWQITSSGVTYPLNDQVVNEAVRFDLPHPARVHGFAIQWAGLPPGIAPSTELPASLSRDFGYNGFDFWPYDPYWTGTRCAQDVAPGAWLTYVFDQPVEIAQPGLVYVTHQAGPTTDPVFAFDGVVHADCAPFASCHSAMNLPQVEAAQYFNGLSFSFSHDYLVRLYVEYTEQLADSDRFFQVLPFPAPRGHASFGDYDDDGWDDLVTDGPTLYRNDHDGTFTDATAASGIAAMGVTASGGVWGDFDNDGCLDLFLFTESTTAPNSLLRSNCDGTFANATAGSGIDNVQSYNLCGGDPSNNRSPAAAAAWVDLDADGRLDLYLSNFICWTDETYYVDQVFHNLGGGHFEEWTGTRGFLAAATASRGVNPIDHDGDGDVDVLVNNYRLQANLFFDNAGNGTFAESAWALGLAGDKHGSSYGHSIGTAWGDLDDDGDFDLVVANLAHPRFFAFSDKTEVLLHGPDGTFTDNSGDWAQPSSAQGLRYQETYSVPALADVDLDGNLDLAITAVYDGRPTDFYWGNGDGTFRLDAYHAGLTTTNGWGLAVSDFDNDGDPDLFAHVPFENSLPAARKGHFVQVRVVGNVAANRAAIGATVRVTAGGKTRLRYVPGGTGQGNQDSQYLGFGLGATSIVDAIGVTFPGGKRVDFAGPFAADQRIWVYEDGTTHLGWAPP